MDYRIRLKDSVRLADFRLIHAPLPPAEDKGERRLGEGGGGSLSTPLCDSAVADPVQQGSSNLHAFYLAIIFGDPCLEITGWTSLGCRQANQLFSQNFHTSLCFPFIADQQKPALHPIKRFSAAESALQP